MYGINLKCGTKRSLSHSVWDHNRISLVCRVYDNIKSPLILDDANRMNAMEQTLMYMLAEKSYRK